MVASFVRKRIDNVVNLCAQQNACIVVVEQIIVVVYFQPVSVSGMTVWLSRKTEAYTINSKASAFPGLFYSPLRQNIARVTDYNEHGVAVMPAGKAIDPKHQIRSAFEISESPVEPYYVGHIAPMFQADFLQIVRDAILPIVGSAEKQVALQTLNSIRSQINPPATPPGTPYQPPEPLTVVTTRLKPGSARMRAKLPAIPVPANAHPAHAQVGRCCNALQGAGYLQLVHHELAVSLRHEQKLGWLIDDIALLPAEFALPDLLWFQQSAQPIATFLDPHGFGITIDDRRPSEAVVRQRMVGMLQRGRNSHSSCRLHELLPFFGCFPDIFPELSEAIKIEDPGGRQMLSRLSSAITGAKRYAERLAANKKSVLTGPCEVDIWWVSPLQP